MTAGPGGLAGFLIFALAVRWRARRTSPGVTALLTAGQLDERRQTEEACHGVAPLGRRRRLRRFRVGVPGRNVAPAADTAAEQVPAGLAADLAAVADAVRADPALAQSPAPLTPLDEMLLDVVAACMPAYHHATVDRGRQLADLFRARAPLASDEELSRGVLHLTHVLQWAGQQLGDPGFYGHVAIELGICAYELTELERSDVTQ